MKIIFSGSSGLIGAAAIPHWEAAGHDIVRLTRDVSQVGQNSIYWDPSAHLLAPQALEGADALVHLGGTTVAKRWSPQIKAEIVRSRVQSTSLLAKTVAGLKHPPRVWLCASAIGYYGDRGAEELTEQSPAGSGFFAEVGEQWEAATLPASQVGTRVVSLRFGIVLTPKGGALSKMLLPFRLGLGGPLGNGHQFWSWVSLQDAVGAMDHLVHAEQVSGPVNVVSPAPMRNLEFTQVLAAVLRRPAPFRVPAPVLKLALGAEMAAEMLLSSSRVRPEKLIKSGYVFRHPELREALEHMLSLRDGETK